MEILEKGKINISKNTLLNSAHAVAKRTKSLIKVKVKISLLQAMEAHRVARG
jgi:hypothetical protein